MRESVNKANSLFAKIFDHSIMIILSGRVRQEGRESLYKGKRLQRGTMGQWKRERGQDEEEITIKPQACQHPATAISNFKGELCRAHRICSSEADFKKEVKFLLDLFEDNGHKRDKLEEIARNYSPPSISNHSTQNK